MLAGPASAGLCGQGSYSYAGIGTRTVTTGVSAAITPAARLAVRDGHAAGWVGVGGVGQGPRGTDAWIQIGLSAFPGETTSRVYYEIAQPGRKPVYRELRTGVLGGERHHFAVIELRSRPGWWRAWLDGMPASAPVFMPGSHGTWTAQVLGESWSGATSGSCNVFSYAFGRVSVVKAGSRTWGAARGVDLFQDANYRLVRTSPWSFLAASTGTAPPSRAPAATASPTP